MYSLIIPVKVKVQEEGNSMNKLGIYVEVFKMLDKKTLYKEFWDHVKTYCVELAELCAKMLEGNEVEIARLSKNCPNKLHEKAIKEWQNRYDNLENEIKKNKELNSTDKMVLEWGMFAIKDGTLLHLSYVARARIDKAIKWAKNYHPLITKKEKKEIEELKENLFLVANFVMSGQSQKLACNLMKEKLGDYYKEIEKKL